MVCKICLGYFVFKGDGAGGRGNRPGLYSEWVFYKRRFQEACMRMGS